jgi:hypothetical protein
MISRLIYIVSYTDGAFGSSSRVEAAFESPVDAARHAHGLMRTSTPWWSVESQVDLGSTDNILKWDGKDDISYKNSNCEIVSVEAHALCKSTQERVTIKA